MAWIARLFAVREKLYSKRPIENHFHQKGSPKELLELHISSIVQLPQYVFDKVIQSFTNFLGAMTSTKKYGQVITENRTLVFENCGVLFRFGDEKKLFRRRIFKLKYAVLKLRRFSTINTISRRNFHETLF